MTTCIDDTVSSGDDSYIDALSSLVVAYNRFIDQELSFRRERIMATANELRADLNGPGNVALVIDALKFWNLAAKPSQFGGPQVPK